MEWAYCLMLFPVEVFDPNNPDQTVFGVFKKDLPGDKI